MVLVVVAVLVGLLAGRLRRPAGGHGLRPRVRGLWLLGTGLALVASTLALDGDLVTVVNALGLAVLAAFAGANRSITGFAVVGLGLVGNLAALVLNNGLPVRAEALLRADVVEPTELATYRPDEPRHVETDADAFGWLGLIVPVPLVREVLSFGDLVVLIGLADAMRDVFRRRARPTLRDEAGYEAGGGAYDAATTQASVDQDWGVAPSDSPESGSQYSEKADARAAAAKEFWSNTSVSPSPAHLAARHDK